MSSSIYRVTRGLLAGLALVIVAPPWAAGESDELHRAESAPSEASLLDVAVLVLDANLPDEPAALRDLEADGIFSEAREAESRYLPVVLQRTLQSSGFWGQVRVLPGPAISDVTVSGIVLSSSGAKLELEVRVADSRGKVWLEKRYAKKADASTYLKRELAEDPFQAVHNRIANDTLKRYRRLDSEDIRQIHSTSRMRFAADLAPEAFASYVKAEKNSRYTLARLPARDDSMMNRVDRIRDRDSIFMDIVDEYYRGFHAQMRAPYDSWRAHDYWRRGAMKTVRPTSTSRGPSPWSPGALDGGRPWNGFGSSCGTPRLLGGSSSSQQGLDAWAGRDANGHLKALRELGASLAADVAPLLVEVDGQVMRLTGSLESQYARWRTLIRDIYAEETGLPVLSVAPVADEPAPPQR
jgi:hypothetical protein